MKLVDSNAGTRAMKGTLSGGVALSDISASAQFTVTYSPAVTITSNGGTSTVTVLDSQYTQFTAATTLNGNNLIPSVPLIGHPTGNAVFTSSNPGVATVDQSGKITPVSVGMTLITIVVPGLGLRVETVVITQTVGGTSTTFSNFVSGSLGAHLVGQASGVLNGKTPPDLSGTPPFTNSIMNQYLSDGMTRNTSVYTGAIDLTCIPSSIASGFVGGVLVTPRDMICAAHYGPYSASGTFVFIDGNNIHYARNVVGQRVVAGTDINALTLDSDLPSSITPAQCMPSSYQTSLPVPDNGYPVFYSTQDRTIVLGDYYFRTASGLFSRRSFDSVRKNWFYQVRGGDSGSPCFHLINGKLVVLHVWYQIQNGPAIADNLTAINTALSANGSPYALTTVNLSGFTP